MCFCLSQLTISHTWRSEGEGVDVRRREHGRDTGRQKTEEEVRTCSMVVTQAGKQKAGGGVIVRTHIIREYRRSEPKGQLWLIAA